nr:MAG TPA: hypothetical protein [Caudoviricetes sp.]
MLCNYVSYYWCIVLCALRNCYNAFCVYAH